MDLTGGAFEPEGRGFESLPACHVSLDPVSDALSGDSQSRKLLIERLYPMLNRHEIAGAEGEAINIRWEAEMKQASEELREILGRR